VVSQDLHSRGRALIVEDDYLIAVDLEAAMSAMGFDVCDLAASDRQARTLAMSDHPDVVLMDVCLAGGREGIETARWLQDVCGAPVVFVTARSDDASTVKRIHERVPGAPVLSKPVRRGQLVNAVAQAESRTMQPGHRA
jgi:DNA-binding response OmpR family regulator